MTMMMHVCLLKYACTLVKQVVLCVCTLQIYIRPDLLNLIMHGSDGRLRLRMRDLELSAGDGPVMSIRDGWNWHSEEAMWSATLVMIEGNLGWFTIVVAEFPPQQE